MSTQRYSNEMNAFRSGIEQNIANHRDKTAMVNQALGVKAQKVFDQGKKLADAGGKLVESGIGVSATSGPGGALVRKGITKFKQIKDARIGEAKVRMQKIAAKAKELNDRASAKGQDILDQAKNKVSNAQDSMESKAADLQSKASDLQESAQSKASDLQSKASDLQDSAESKASDLQESAQSKVSQATDAVETKTGDVTEAVETKAGSVFDERNPSQQAQELNDNINTLRTGGVGGEGRPAQGRFTPEEQRATGLPTNEGGGTTSAGEGAATQGVGGDSKGVLELPTKSDSSVAPSADGPSVQSGSADAGTPDAAGTTDGSDAIGNIAVDEASNTAARVVGSVGGDELLSTTLEEAAAATSWLAWLGVPELLAGAGAIAGVAGAVSGVVEAVKGGNTEAAAQAMKTSVPTKTAQLAGSFVTPTQDSLS